MCLNIVINLVNIQLGGLNTSFSKPAFHACMQETFKHAYIYVCMKSRFRKACS